MNELAIKEIKMTSLELAELTGKRHDNVMRDIKNEIEALGEDNALIFELVGYADAKGEKRPCYEFSKDGAMQLALKYDALTRRRVIVKIEELEKMQIPTGLDYLQSMLDQMKAQDTQIKFATAQSRKALEVAESIKSEVLEDYTDNWRDDINSKVREIAIISGIPFHDLFTNMYSSLEQKARCDLSALTRNKTKRMNEQGATKTHIKAECTKIALIEDNPRLKEIFTSIVKEYAVKYVA